jgi:hypothetical protein
MGAKLPAAEAIISDDSDPMSFIPSLLGWFCSFQCAKCQQHTGGTRQSQKHWWPAIADKCGFYASPLPKSTAVERPFSSRLGSNRYGGHSPTRNNRREPKQQQSSYEVWRGRNMSSAITYKELK